MPEPLDTSLPPQTEPLPALTQHERTKAMRAVRIVKKGDLYMCRFHRHEKSGRVLLEWAESGGFDLLDPNT
jgi:hypothetical protein